MWGLLETGLRRVAELVGLRREQMQWGSRLLWWRAIRLLWLELQIPSILRKNSLRRGRFPNLVVCRFPHFSWFLRFSDSCLTLLTPSRTPSMSRVERTPLQPLLHENPFPT